MHVKHVKYWHRLEHLSGYSILKEAYNLCKSNNHGKNIKIAWIKKVLDYILVIMVCCMLDPMLNPMFGPVCIISS